jgi:hypothetical protein
VAVKGARGQPAARVPDGDRLVRRRCSSGSGMGCVGVSRLLGPRRAARGGEGQHHRLHRSRPLAARHTCGDGGALRLPAAVVDRVHVAPQHLAALGQVQVPQPVCGAQAHATPRTHRQ